MSTSESPVALLRCRACGAPLRLSSESVQFVTCHHCHAKLVMRHTGTGIQTELADPPAPQNEAQRAQQERRLFRGIMLAILVWGSILSLGTFLFGIDHERGGIRYSPSPLRGAIMLSFVVAFVIGWKALLSRRRRT